MKAGTVLVLTVVLGSKCCVLLCVSVAWQLALGIAVMMEMLVFRLMLHVGIYI